MINRLDNYINLYNKRHRLLAEISRIEKMQKEYAPMIMNSGVGGVHSGGVSMPTENAALKELTFFAETEAELKEKRQELTETEAELTSLDNYIEAIPDDMLKEIFKRKFTNGESWTAIAISYHYSPSSWVIMKKRALDYIKSNDFI